MITVILEKRQRGGEIARVSRSGNEKYLLANESYKVLSTLDEYSYDVFDRSDMPELIQELCRIKESLDGVEDPMHIDEIISLAERCGSDKDLVLAFTPFE